MTTQVPTQYKKILVIGDYGKNDLAFHEVAQCLYELAEKAGLHVQIDTVSVDAFNTAQTAAVTAEAVRLGQWDMVFHNTAPRKHVKGRLANNEGEHLAFTRLIQPVGRCKEIRVIGVAAADESGVNTFSMLRGAEVYDVPFENPQKSQFRSRDVFPQKVIELLKGELRPGKKLEVSVRPGGEWEKALVGDAAGRLAHKLGTAVHGDAAKAHVTIIAGGPARDHVWLEQTITPHLLGAEIDLLPLKYAGHPEIEGGFSAAQLALNAAEGSRRSVVVFAGQHHGPEDCEHLYLAPLDNGARIIADDLKALAFVLQFGRGRLAGDVLDYAKGNDRRLSLGEDGLVALSGPSVAVPAAALDAVKLPEGPHAAYVDGYGNVKTTLLHDKALDLLRQPQLSPGERLTLAARAHDRELGAHYSDGSFSVADGEAALSRGSSGWAETCGGPKRHFAEIFLRGGNAARALGDVSPGEYVSLSVQKRAAEKPSTVVDAGTAVVTGPQIATGVAL